MKALFLLLLVPLLTFASGTQYFHADDYNINGLGTLSDDEWYYMKGVTSNVQTQFNLKAPLASPALTGTPTAPTQSAGDNSTKIATTAYADGAVSTLGTRVTTLEGYDKVLEFANFAAFPGTGAASTVYIDKALNKTYRWNGSAYALIGDGQGAGDVVGPASATDNAVTRFDTTTGKLIQNSTAILSDTGDLTLNSVDASSTSTTSSFSGVQISNNTVTATGGSNLTLTTSGATNNIQFPKNAVFQKTLLHTTGTDTASGANATLTAPTTKYVRLTAAGTLTSIDMIPAGLGFQELVLVNATGATVSINNETGATAANRIYTGTGGAISLADKASIALSYDTTSARWQVQGGTGSGSGQGGINYIGTNYNAENTTTTGWSCYSDGASSTPVDGTGGSPSTAISNVASTSLSGSRLFEITKTSGASRQGEGCSFAFTIDSSYKAKVLRITFPYITSANIADDDYRIYIFDVTNSRIIEVDNRDLKANAQGQYVGSFQTSSDSTSYKLILHTTTANNYSATLDIDDVTISPQTLYKGPVITPWQTYAPVISGFNGTSHTDTTGRWRRVGDSAEIEIYHQVTGAGSGGTAVSYSIPSGLSIDLSKHTNGGTVGSAETYNVEGANAFHPAGLVISGSALSVLDTGGSGFYTGASFVVGAQARLHAMVPITGWNSNVAMSEDGGQRLITAQYVSNGGQAIASAVTDIPFSTFVYDLTASWNGTQFTAPETGYYSFKGAVRISSAANLGLLSYVNGSLIRGLTMDTGTGTGTVRTFSGEQFLTKGQTLSIRSNASATLVADTNNHWIAIHKLASPQTMAGGPIVHARYSTNAGQSVVHGDIVNFEDKEEDTHNAVTTGTGVWKFTAPRPDKYDIELYTFTNNISETVGNSFAVPCTINATTTIRASVHYVQNTVSHALDSQLASVVNLNKGDYIQCSFSENVGAITLIPSGEYNYISITSRGN